MNVIRKRGKRALFQAAATALFLACAVPWPARAEEPVVIKGIVVDVRPGILYLKDIQLEGKAVASGSMIFLLGENTEYYEGLERAHRDSIAPDRIVLVKYVEDETGKKALLVRIIGKGTP